MLSHENYYNCRGIIIFYIWNSTFEKSQFTRTIEVSTYREIIVRKLLCNVSSSIYTWLYTGSLSIKLNQKLLSSKWFSSYQSYSIVTLKKRNLKTAKICWTAEIFPRCFCFSFSLTGYLCCNMFSLAIQDGLELQYIMVLTRVRYWGSDFSRVERMVKRWS